MATSNHAAAGAWADLIGLDGNERVLFIGSDRSKGAIERLRSRARDVTTITGPMEVRELAQQRWNVVVCEHLGFETAVAVAAQFASADQLVFVIDNKLSPLAPKAGFGPGWTPRMLLRFADRLGDQAQIFALLRSADLPTTSFRLDLPQLASVVLTGAAVGAGPVRAQAIAWLARLAKRDLAKYVVPAWLIVRSNRADSPTGRLAVAENDQGVVLYGSGPDSIEKVFTDPADIEAVRQATATLGAAGLDVEVGRVLSQPFPNRLRLEWVDGDVLDANALEPRLLAIWTERAAEVLGLIHSRSLADDRSVLVHGDFWLGAVVVRGDSIIGVIDWTDSRRGSPVEDLQTLTAVSRSRSDLTSSEREIVVTAARRGYQRGGGDAWI
jgi:hypothetical protein